MFLFSQGTAQLIVDGLPESSGSVLSEGDIVGDMCVLFGVPQSHTVITTEKCVCVEITREIVLRSKEVCLPAPK